MKASRKDPSLPVLRFADQAAWLAWLDAHHAASPGIWLDIPKKSSGLDGLTYLEALEAALCYGWIDGQKKSLSEASWLQKFTPRGPRSIWSKANRDKALALVAEGKMQPAGMAAVERARQDGAWEAAYDSQSTSAVPDDLQTALDQNPEAQAFFAGLDSRNRYAILFRLQTARKPETRSKRLREFILMLERNEKLYP